MLWTSLPAAKAAGNQPKFHAIEEQVPLMQCPCAVAQFDPSDKNDYIKGDFSARAVTCQISRPFADAPQEDPSLDSDRT